jgi:S-DNA-T family DNA segregation ATPase FtsK/SpoIIIE
MATTVEAGRVELRLLVSTASRGSTAVELDAPGDATVGAAADAIAGALKLGRGELYVERLGACLERDVELRAAGLRHGDRIALGEAFARTEAGAAQLELVVVGGPASGRRVPLYDGEYVVGRDGASDIRLDDPAMSANHLRLRVTGSEVEAEDLGSRNGTTVEGSALEPGRTVSLAPGAVVRAGRTLVAVEPSSAAEAPNVRSLDGSVPFNRPPRVHRPPTAAVRPVPAPPDSPQRSRLPLGASLIPLVLGVGLFLIFHMVTFLFFSLLSPVMAISTFFEDRRSGRKGFQTKSREYREGLVELRDELEESRRNELAARRAAAPSAAELLRRARSLDPSLWERRLGDSDFLSLRVGSSDLPALLSVQLGDGGAPDLRAEVEQLTGWYATAPAVPVELPLAELGTAGICGPEEGVHALARWLVAQAAALHSPRDLTVAAAIGEQRLAGWTWLRWLPHTAGPGGGLAQGVVRARSLVEELGRLVEERRRAAEEGLGGRRSGWPGLLVVLDEAVAPERSLVAEVLNGAAEAGVGVLWLGRERRDLPGECAAIVELDHTAPRLSLTDARRGEPLTDVSVDTLPVELAEEVALALAPVRDTSAGRGAGVPDRVGLLETLGLDEVSPATIGARWDEGYGELGAPIGMASQGPFVADLRVDGPHALIAGMTGAGKSELLQSMIAALAASHPPDRLSFLLVDYKGGAAFKDCVHLPHTVGLVTDLDKHLTERALLSLNAELRRRELILREAGAKDLADMERRDADRAPASLVIVIDEFATLAKEVPEFIEGVVDVAQRGRSLGVHLVLATQRPGGVVSENIRANTNLRIALRVATGADSSDVIGVPEAGRISRDRPGRAFARTGHGELDEVQVAYAGTLAPAASDDRSIQVRQLRFDLDRRADAEHAAGTTDLERLVDAAVAAARERGLERQPSPWLPPLPSVLTLDELPDPEQPGQEAVLGLLDEPSHQRQEPLTLDLEAEGSVLVYGTSGSGKTTLLRTLAVSLAQHVPVEDLHVYGLDFATRGLRILEELPHCGAVVPGEDEERTARLFALLRATLERRKALFAERGAFTLSEYRRSSPPEPVPRVLVLLDGYAGFAAAFERVNLGELVDLLPRLVGDGRPLGVHFAISADRRGAVPNSLNGIVPAKFVLRMADEDEFAALGVPPRTVRGAYLPPGRGFLPGGTEIHAALVGSEQSGEGQAAAVAELGQQLRRQAGGRRAPGVEPLPTRVERETLPAPAQPQTALLGLGGSDLQPVAVDLSERHFLVVGPYRSGRSTTLATLVESLRRGTPGLELHLLAPRRSPLVRLPFWTSAADGLDACEEAAAQLAQALEERRAGTRGPFTVVIDDGEELAESLGAAALETVVRRGRDLDVRVLAAAERQAAQRAFGGWLRELRKEEHGLLLDPDPDVDGDILGVRLPRRSNPVFPTGRGYLVQRGTIELVQVGS